MRSKRKHKPGKKPASSHCAFTTTTNAETGSSLNLVSDKEQAAPPIDARQPSPPDSELQCTGTSAESACQLSPKPQPESQSTGTSTESEVATPLSDFEEVKFEERNWN